MVYVDKGNIEEALNSMISDLKKHKETAGHMAIASGKQLMLSGKLNTCQEMRKFIDGFN